jgi:hypothetical protein
MLDSPDSFNYRRNMNPAATHGITFLAGIVVGAAGAYFGDLFTDQRRRKEDARKSRELFGAMVARMPDLLREMRTDVRDPDHRNVRDFFVIPESAQLTPDGKAFVYRVNSGNDYLSKVGILEASGYVRDITPGNAPKFRMTEEFVSRLEKWAGYDVPPIS